MAVTRDDVMHIAALARLALPEERVPELVAQLNGILKHLELLQELETAADRIDASRSPGDTDEPAPATRAAPAASLAPTRLRPDVGPPLPLATPREQFAARTLDGTVAMRDGFFIVPRLATHEGDEGAE